MSASAMAQRFTGITSKSGGRVLIRLPFNPDEAWGKKARHHITGTINGHTYRGSIISNSTNYFISLGEAWRRDADIEFGTTVEVVLQPEGPQHDTIAPDIAAAVSAEPDAQRYFESLATFYRRNYVKWIENAKRPETRAARITETVALLKLGRKQK
jgi:hypothetical protein